MKPPPIPSNAEIARRAREDAQAGARGRASATESDDRGSAESEGARAAIERQDAPGEAAADLCGSPAQSSGEISGAPRGRPFPPGVSGNPGGRPALPPWFREGAEDALRFLLEVATGKARDRRISRAQACITIVERVYGRPAQAVEVQHEGGDPLERLKAAITSLAGRGDDSSGAR